LERTFRRNLGVKHDRAVDCLIKDREALLAYYDFPAEQLETSAHTNVIESEFATVRHPTVRANGRRAPNFVK